jgi:hypothetical protein
VEACETADADAEVVEESKATDVCSATDTYAEIDDTKETDACAEIDSFTTDFATKYSGASREG